MVPLKAFLICSCRTCFAIVLSDLKTWHFQCAVGSVSLKYNQPPWKFLCGTVGEGSGVDVAVAGVQSLARGTSTCCRCGVPPQRARSSLRNLKSLSQPCLLSTTPQIFLPLTQTFLSLHETGRQILLIRYLTGGPNFYERNIQQRSANLLHKGAGSKYLRLHGP